MSDQYIFEPPTKGKVCIETTLGPIDIELWSKECPKASRNFIQLCMEGYYDKCIFHTIMKDIIAQTGDPSNTGENGSSIYEKDFKVEAHQRLRFNRRGLVAMAASPDGFCGSQFFITLAGPTPELDKKHTLFGKITGNTIFNFMAINEVEVDSDRRPVHPERVKIISTRILANPFDDIVPRRVIRHEKRKDKKDKYIEVKKKNTGLLSFGDEMDEDESLGTSKKFKSISAHDILDDENLSKAVAVQPEELGLNNEMDDDGDAERLSRVQERLKSRKRKVNFQDNEQEEQVDFHDALEQQQKAEKREEVERLASEAKALELQYLRSLRGPKQKADPDDESKMSDAMKDYKKLKLKYKSKTEGIVKSADPQREEQTMSLLNRFETTMKRSSVQGVLNNRKVDTTDLPTIKELLKETAIPKKRKLPADMMPKGEDGEDIIIETIPEEIKPEFDDNVVDETDQQWLGHILIAANNESTTKSD